MPEYHSTIVCILTAVTNFVAIVPISEALKRKKSSEAGLILITAIASFLHHLTSTSHDLVPLFGASISTPLLWFDRIAATTLILYVLKSIYLKTRNLKKLKSLLQKSTFLLIPALLGLFISDILLHRTYDSNMYKMLYCYSHCTWHIFAFLLVNRIQRLQN